MSTPGNQDVVLQRGAPSPVGTRGNLTLNGELLCYTLERPWLENQNDVSDIPPGFYTVIKHNSPKFQDVWEVTNVPGREAILIHAGNTVQDTHGCILVGLGIADGGISKSQAALAKLRGIFPGGFRLEIRSAG